MIKEHRIPTIFALVFLIIGLGFGVFLVQQGNLFFLKASPDTTPSEIKITNLSDSSFTVSWLTVKEATGYVRFGEAASSLDQTALDDRDQVSGQTGSFYTHYITLKNLKPKTKYFFKIGSQGQSFGNNDKPYETTTADTMRGNLPVSDLATGKILFPDGKPASNTIIYLKMGNMTPQSALVGKDGAWLVSLSTALSLDLIGFVSYDKKAQVEEIFVQGAPQGTATAIALTNGDNPIPDITLGKNYDFRQSGALGGNNNINPSDNLTPSPALPLTPTSTPGSSGFTVTTTPPPDTGQITLSNPAKEGETINTAKPDFAGTGPAGKTLQILVESQKKYTGVAVANKDGLWDWTPPADLTPGEHKITVTYLGKSITRSFLVLAKDSSDLPAFTATPSAQTPTPTRPTTPTPSANQTPTPSTRLTPTPSRVSTPTATPVPRTQMPATTSGIPASGDLTPTFLIFIMGLTFILGGFVVKRRLY